MRAVLGCRWEALRTWVSKAFTTRTASLGSAPADAELRAAVSDSTSSAGWRRGAVLGVAGLQCRTRPGHRTDEHEDE